MSSFSNRCGIAQDFYIAAPGQSLLVAYPDTHYWGSGTSYSAPMVSGGLAIMKQLFRGQ
ncbi:MAG: S8 family serine peptidase, partial [Synechococcus sp. SB0667_bin_8]|nr:S8 family serine peptidase [Synechococcus sp. SB0667_bin_8]